MHQTNCIRPKFIPCVHFVGQNERWCLECARVCVTKCIPDDDGDELEPFFQGGKGWGAVNKKPVYFAIKHRFESLSLSLSLSHTHTHTHTHTQHEVGNNKVSSYPRNQPNYPSIHCTDTGKVWEINILSVNTLNSQPTSFTFPDVILWWLNGLKAPTNNNNLSPSLPKSNNKEREKNRPCKCNLQQQWPRCSNWRGTSERKRLPMSLSCPPQPATATNRASCDVICLADGV